MWVAVLLVDAAALGDDLVDLGAAQGGGLLVRGGGGLGAAAGEVLGGRALGQAQGELVAGEDGRGWERVLVVSYVCLSGGLTLPPHRGVESAPEVVKLLLGRQLNLRGVALYKDGHLGDHGPAGRAVGRSITIKRHGGELLLNPHTHNLSESQTARCKQLELSISNAPITTTSSKLSHCLNRLKQRNKKAVSKEKREKHPQPRDPTRSL
jgi:hypothetical protein